MGPTAEAQMGIDKILASQSLWDATMSDSVAKYLKKNKRPLVVHLNGGFHTSTVWNGEHLLRYRPKTDRSWSSRYSPRTISRRSQGENTDLDT